MSGSEGRARHRGLMPALAAALLLTAVAGEHVARPAHPGALVSACTVLIVPLSLTWSRRLASTGVRWTAAFADAAAVTLVAGLPRWWPAGAVGPGGHPRPERALDVAAVLAVLLTLFVMAATWDRTRVRASTRALLGGGLVTLAVHAAVAVASDGAAVPSSGWQRSPWWAVLPVVAVGCWTGVAALCWAGRDTDPHALTRMRPGSALDEQTRGGRLALLALLGGAAPASLLVGNAPVTAADVLPVVVSCGLLAGCTLAHLSWRAGRLAGLARERSEAADQQQHLVAVGAGLLQASDREQVVRAAATGAVQLLAAAEAVRAAAAVALGPPDLLDLAAVDSIGLALQDTAGVDLSVLTDADRTLLRRGEAVLRTLDGPAAVAGSSRPGRSAVDGPRTPDVLLVLPLRSRRRHLGALLVAGPQPAVCRTRPSLEAFAVHVALALDAVDVSARPSARSGDTVPAAAPAGLVSAVTRGLRAGEFACHYQPVVDMVDASVVGFEALVRWSHPQRGLLLPGAFLAAVEDAGLLTMLDDHLLAEACRDLMLIDPRPSGPYVSVNLSRGQLAGAALTQRVQASLAASGLAPWRLQLEVTEASSLERPEQAAETLRRLRGMRVRVAFDDFGTGASSLSWLHQLPLDVVKVDKSFVDQLPVPPGTPPVVAAVTALAHVLGLGVIAEGVETPEQERELLAMGVRHAQGWRYAKALPLAQAREYARSRHSATRPALPALPLQPVAGEGAGQDEGSCLAG